MRESINRDYKYYKLTAISPDESQKVSVDYLTKPRDVLSRMLAGSRAWGARKSDTERIAAAFVGDEGFAGVELV